MFSKCSLLNPWCYTLPSKRMLVKLPLYGYFKTARFSKPRFFIQFPIYNRCPIGVVYETPIFKSPCKITDIAISVIAELPFAGGVEQLWFWYLPGSWDNESIPNFKKHIKILSLTLVIIFEYFLQQRHFGKYSKWSVLLQQSQLGKFPD